MFMDCLVLPKDCPNPELAYKMINHIISVEPQKQFATEQSAGITNLKAVPTLPEELRASALRRPRHLHDQGAAPAGAPTEDDGTTATYDDFLTEYQRSQAA